ncbi:MAG: hypothetical protein KGZ83_04500 [Sulfuricella sp.]|nr:hypothetical protein [Sulfuricella sp.]
MMLCRHVVALVLLFLAAGTANAETIGLRFVVDNDLVAGRMQRPSIQTALGKWVAELNGYYRDSEVNLQAEIVAVDFTAVGSKEVMQILEDMAKERNGFTAMFGRADEFGADYTVAVVSHLLIRGKLGCGRAFAVNKTLEAISISRTAFAAIDFACGAHTLAHELGHLMGLNHGSLVDQCDPGKNHTVAIAPYALGYGVGNCDGKPQAGEFGDIMVGGWMRQINGNGKGNLPIFSNPRIRDSRCGLEGICGDPISGDAARALNENARRYAAHEEPDVHVLYYEDAALRACIVEKYRGTEIADLSELACPLASIVSLAGMERLMALRNIDLAGNDIRDASPLEMLPAEKILRLDLRGNHRISCQSLDRLSAKLSGKLVRPATCRAVGR